MSSFEDAGLEPENIEEVPEFDIIQEQAAFLQEVAMLIADLPEIKQPDREDHTFHFPILPYSTPFEIPKGLKLSHSDIDEVDIFMGDVHVPEHANDTPRQPYITVDVTSGNTTYKFSRSGEEEGPELALVKFDLEGHSPYEHDTEFKKRFTEIGSVSTDELNALLMSIVIPNDASDYDAYRNKELQSPAAFESLKELLRRKSYQTSSVYFFELQDGESTLLFTKDDSSTTSFTIQYFDEKLKVPVVVEYDVESDFRLRFFTYGDHKKQVIIPTAAELRNVRNLLKNEVNPYMMETFLDEEQSQTEGNPEEMLTAEPSNNELSGAVEDVLNELGLNPPDTGA
jgi:hypothetical protein